MRSPKFISPSWACSTEAQFKCDKSWNVSTGQSMDSDPEVLFTEEGKAYTTEKEKVTCKKCKGAAA